jgi:hypothetical protein
VLIQITERVAALDKQCAPSTPEELAEEFWYSCYMGDVVAVESLWLRRDVSNIDMNWINPRQDTPEGVKKPMTPFYCACALGNAAVVSFLLKNNQKVYDKEKKWTLDVHVTNDRACNVIWAACNGGHVRVLKLLLKLTSVDFERPDCNGITPLEIAEANASTGDGSWRNGSTIIALLKGKLYTQNARSVGASVQIDKSLISSHVGPMNSMLTPGLSLHSREENNFAAEAEGLAPAAGSTTAAPGLWRLATDPRYQRCSVEDFEVAAKDLLQSRRNIEQQNSPPPLPLCSKTS